ncbi:hypothetical protein ACXIHB_13020 [Tenacibaculum sp. IMCC1]|uniref:Uncharacterized protein n=1 Tax=Tenacibaculum sp. Pbs-1 TaxID=3238748 RepID=A0AB33KZ42_9FLAO
MKEEKRLKSKKYIPKVYYRGELLNHKETPLTVKETELCPYCKEEITFEQVKHVVPEAEKEITEKILVYLNKYRKDYKLDTCLRKAHFIAQVGAEMKFLKKNMQESHNYNYASLPQKYFSKSYTIDSIILESLKNNLNEIFKIVDKSGKIKTKTNIELKSILNEENVVVDVRRLYGKNSKEKTIKEVKEKVKDKTGNEVEELKFKIILKKHKAFRIPLFSRFYATYPNDKRGLGNGNELSREGFMFCGKGIKQLTGKGNYISFSNFRKNNPFPDDPKGYIDFTKITDKTNYKGNFDLLADTNNVIYGVQSALWFYQKGGVSIQKKYAADWAAEDDIKRSTRIINGGYNGIRNRRDNTFKARTEKGFKVYKHYEKIYEKGTKEQQELIENILLNISQEEKVKTREYDNSLKKMVTAYVDLKDVEAEKLLKKLKEVKPVNSLKPKGIKLFIESDLKLTPLKNE